MIAATVRQHRAREAMLAAALSFLECQTRQLTASTRNERRHTRERQAMIATSLSHLQKCKEQRKLRKAKHMVREVL